MASDLDFVQFVADQMAGAGPVAYRKMFGEYAVYCDGKVVALICDNQLYVKPTEAGRAFIGAVVEAPPYPGAKPSFLIGEQVEDGETDHKVLAAPVHEQRVLDAATITNLETFIRGVFAHLPGKTIQLGRVLGPAEAAAYVAACREEPPAGTDRLHS